jgi:hypothetical protein
MIKLSEELIEIASMSLNLFSIAITFISVAPSFIPRPAMKFAAPGFDNA